MRRSFLILLTLSMGFLSTVSAQTEYTRQIDSLLKITQRTTKDIVKADLFHRVATIYYNNQQKIKNGSDSALLFEMEAAALSKKAGYDSAYQRYTQMQVLMYFYRREPAKAIATIQQLNDTNRINSLQIWANCYRTGTYGVRKNIDTATLLYFKAWNEAKALNNPDWIAKSLNGLAFFYCSQNDIENGKKYAALAEACYAASKKVKLIGNMWYNMGKAMDTVDRNFPDILYCYRRSIEVFRQLNSKRDIAFLLMRFGDIHFNQGYLDSAENEFLQTTALLKELQYREMHQIYIRMADLYMYTGDFNKSVYYSIEGLKSAEAFGVKNLSSLYFRIGNTYLDQGQPEKSLDGYTKAFASARASDKIIEGVYIKKMARALIELGRKEEALAFVQNAFKEFNCSSPKDLMMKAESLGNCYYALQQNEKAEYYYQQMMEAAKSVPLYFSVISPFAIGKFYFATKQYDKAAAFLYKFLQQPSGLIARHVLSESYLMMYKIDSANRQYSSALNYFRRYKQLNDSIFTETRSKQMAELRIQYDIEKKDKDLLLKDQALLLKEKGIELLTREKLLQQSLAEQKSKDIILKEKNIDLLTQQAALQQAVTEKQQHELILKESDLQLKEKDIQLKAQNISLLKDKEQLQQAQLREAGFMKKITYAGIALLVIIVALLYNQYRIKQKNNQKVSEKNEELELLLEEKEWLLKEVHHRVKNNLQVVLSLLESQSAYLKDEALAAVHDSQHRVQAMSLIHQKLYQSDNITTIDMDVYVPELIQYLKESFNIRKPILFRLEVDPIQLDVTQAIPLGLILNEAITNAIKHAFTGKENGTVCVSLKQVSEDDFVLDIADNGVGLPTGYEHKRKGSLGMSLMRGLSGDFNADYTIESNEGTHIKVEFSRNISPVDKGKKAMKNNGIAVS